MKMDAPLCIRHQVWRLHFGLRHAQPHVCRKYRNVRVAGFRRDTANRRSNAAMRALTRIKSPSVTRWPTTPDRNEKEREPAAGQPLRRGTPRTQPLLFINVAWALSEPSDYLHASQVRSFSQFCLGYRKYPWNLQAASEPWLLTRSGAKSTASAYSYYVPVDFHVSLLAHNKPSASFIAKYQAEDLKFSSYPLV